MNLAIATAASGHDVLTQAAKAGIIVVVLCVGLRLLGKRQMGELNLYDLAMLMAAANAVQNAMTAGRGDLSVGIATATTVVGVGWLATKVLRLRPRLAVRALGSPTVLVRDGQILQARVRRQRITTAESSTPPHTYTDCGRHTTPPSSCSRSTARSTSCPLTRSEELSLLR